MVARSGRIGQPAFRRAPEPTYRDLGRREAPCLGPRMRLEFEPEATMEPFAIVLFAVLAW